MATKPEKMILYDAQAANTLAVRLFILERGGLDLDVQTIDIVTLENRKPPYRTQVNPRGEVPALRITGGGDNNEDGDFVLTETTAVCEYLDEVAQGGRSLFGDTALQRAETRMWLRRMDLEIAQPVIQWFRNDPATVDFYRGNRVPTPEARLNQKVVVNQFLNLLDEELEGKAWLCGDRFSAADTHFYGLVKLLALQAASWVLDPARKNVAGYFNRMDEREASKAALSLFESRISVPVKA